MRLFRTGWGLLARWTALFYLAATLAAADNPSVFSHATHAPKAPHASEPVQITVSAPDGMTEVQLWYQVNNPGAYIELQDANFKSGWVSQPMAAGKKNAAGMEFTAQMPASLQTNRRLIRYRFTGKDAKGTLCQFPTDEDTVPNFAYFVYNGVPAWTAAISPGSWDGTLGKAVRYDSNVMSRVQSYFLIGKASSVENITWRERAMDKEYRYTGTMVVDGDVYDHVRMRARGGSWRFAMGKNMWKFDFSKGKRLQARDDYGQPYPVSWSKLNLFSCIDQSDFGGRGEQGMFTAVGFRLFNLAGVPASMTHWIQLRIIDGKEENPSNQYKGDYWGLYLAMEDVDGRFLRAHNLPDGNVYKMENGTGTLSHQAEGAVTNRSDLRAFLRAYQSTAPEDSWWEAQLNLPSYYSYRAICEAIHHYDIGGGKNYYYYRNLTTKRWQVIPWDIDLTWADHMFGDGNEPFKQRVLVLPHLRAEYQNRLRELRDLLYNPSETGRLIDEFAAVIADPAGGPSPVDADRAKWDYHPALKSEFKGGHGLFYKAVPSQDFAGMVQLMKNYVNRRSAWIDARLLRSQKVPATPKLTYAGPPDYPASGLSFKVAEYPSDFNFAAAQCRLAEIANPAMREGRPKAPGKYEIMPVWESGDLDKPVTDFSVPAQAISKGHTYRVRTRVKDTNGVWSHWSAPVEFVAGSASK